MNDDNLRFEQELAALAPRRPSAELESRLAAKLRVRPTSHKRPLVRVAWTTAASVALLALVGLVVVWLSTQPSVPAKSSAGLVAGAADIPFFDRSAPTVWNFHRALADPSRELDDLLDRHGGSAGTAAESTMGPLSVTSLHHDSRMGDL